MKGKRVLVTGAGGFIGSHLVERLVNMGAQVSAFVRYNSRADMGALSFLEPTVLREVRLSMGDVRDSQAVLKAMRNQQVVFHLAALVSIPYSYVHPDEVVTTNILGTQNVLNAGLLTDVERIIHTSTSEVYGTAQYVPIDERHPLRGQSPYSASKIGADKLVESYHRAFDLQVATVRPFNTFGPRQSARAVIPTIIAQALTLPEIRLGNLTATRDFTFVEDTVEGFVAAARSTKSVGLEVNLGTGQEIAIGDLVQRIVSMTKSRATVVQETQRLRPVGSEVERLISDNRLAREVLDWQPRVSFDTGLQRVCDWIAANQDFYSASQYKI